MTATVAGIHLGLDTHANRPAANTVPDGSIYSCSTHSLIYKSTFGGGGSWATWATLGAVASGSITASGYTQTTARLLGRTTASTGAIEEITVGTGLSLSAGSLTATAFPSSPSEVFITSDVNISTPGTFVDGPTHTTPTAGTYFMFGAIIVDATAATHATAKLWDGTTVWHATESRTVGAGTELELVVVAGPITLSGSQSPKVSATIGPATTGHILATGGQAGTTNKGSKLSLLRTA